MTLILLLSAAASLCAQEKPSKAGYSQALREVRETYRIYEGAAPGSEDALYPEIVIRNDAGQPVIYNVTIPTITVFRPEASINTGAAVIIAPGGGNMFLTWQSEGVNVAEWFARHGITGIILKYRTNYVGKDEQEIAETLKPFFAGLSGFAGRQKKEEGDGPLKPTLQGDDGRQAVRFVRAHAEELGIDPHRIALLGFSAGAMLTCNVMYINDDDCRPDLAAPVYGISGSGLPSNPVPTFICGPEFDLFPPESLFGLYKSFKEAGLPAELHFIHDAVHGEGLLYNGREWNEWIDLLHAFMKGVRFIP